MSKPIVSYSPPIGNSKLCNWDQLASVRVKPHRLLVEEDMEKIYFPPELVPVCQHPVVLNLGPQVVREIMIHGLYQYLDFTTMLELEAVNPALLQIAQRRVGVDLPDVMLCDAYKIYVDEGYHAFFSADLKQQVEAETGVVPVPLGMPGFLRRLSEIELSVPVESRDMSRIFFTIISETLISALLSKIPTDPRVVPTVREVVADHAEDEGRHHAYFAKFLDFIWPQLTARQKGIIGPLLPEFILAFLQPDYSAVGCVLAHYGLTCEEIELVTTESYPEATVLSGIREGAKATLRHFDRNGILADPHTAEAFQSSGLMLNSQLTQSSSVDSLEPVLPLKLEVAKKPL